MLIAPPALCSTLSPGSPNDAGAIQLVKAYWNLAAIMAELMG